MPHLRERNGIVGKNVLDVIQEHKNREIERTNGLALHNSGPLERLHDGVGQRTRNYITLEACIAHSNSARTQGTRIAWNERTCDYLLVARDPSPRGHVVIVRRHGY